jgi:hypothetical protein
MNKAKCKTHDHLNQKKNFLKIPSLHDKILKKLGIKEINLNIIKATTCDLVLEFLVRSIVQEKENKKDINNT